MLWRAEFYFEIYLKSIYGILINKFHKYISRGNIENKFLRKDYGGGILLIKNN